MKRLALPNGTGSVTVDDDVAARLAGRTVRLDSGGYPYVQLAGRRTYLHRWIVGAAPGQIVDHRNGNLLDARRCNLRLTDDAGNQANRRVVRTRTFLKGVTVHGDGKFQAQIKRGAKNHYLGLFDDPVAAARAYAKRARELSGEFAYSNVNDPEARRKARAFAATLRRQTANPGKNTRDAESLAEGATPAHTTVVPIRPEKAPRREAPAA